MKPLLFYYSSVQARLAELYKKGNEEADQRVAELLSAVEKMKAIVDEVSKERDDLQTSLEQEAIRLGCCVVHAYIILFELST